MSEQQSSQPPQATLAEKRKRRLTTFEQVTLTNLFLSLQITAFHLAVLPGIVQRFHELQLTETEAWLLKNIWQYLGDNENGFFFMTPLLVADFGLYLAEQALYDRQHPMWALLCIIVREKLLPVVAVMGVLLAIIDVETIQWLPDQLLQLLSQTQMPPETRALVVRYVKGTNEIGDIPMGVYGILSALMLYVVYKNSLREDLAEMLR